jgi:xanthine/uracil permease
MTVQEAWNRTNNLVATSILALAGFAFLPEAFIEDHQIYKVDDGALFIVGISALIWYNMKKNSVTRSIAPVIMTVSAAAVKIAWLIIEFKDKDDAGDDFGGVILFVLAAIFVIWLFTRKYKEAK